MIRDEEDDFISSLNDPMSQNLTATIDDTSCPPAFSTRIPASYETTILKNEIKRSISSNSNLQLVSLSTGESIYRLKYNQLRKYAGLDFKTQQCSPSSFPTKKNQTTLLGSLEEKRFLQLRERTRGAASDEEENDEGDEEDDEDFWVDDDENLIDDDEL
ncbi:predicted protein [Naegleria gruberi]|uniref:Predicted protein n=1 Tax=Naegleria gruberi TaxID=5762 RepID=D2UZJ5_NAEGR|nr:uncharacterized protein NAEGRDRAFT_61960 [Naegleria gruberi]EFC50165.1 predicted protein [Naegleria gruberi]|eukprot:XP_002682909.1 predicted protein [Naegleria gruberi strain NEG-M]